MTTINITPDALKQLSQLLCETPFKQCHILFLQVWDQVPELFPHQTISIPNRSDQHARTDATQIASHSAAGQ